MAYVPDFTLAAQDHLLLLLNEENGKSYTFNEISFDPPQVEVGGANTSVIVRAVPGAGYKGSAQLNYNRLDLNVLFTGTVDIAIEEPQTLQESLDQILAQYGINITTDDVELVTNQLGDSLLQSLPGSYLCFGTVEIVWTGATGEDPLQIHGYDGQPLTGYDGQPLTFYAAA